MDRFLALRPTVGRHELCPAPVEAPLVALAVMEVAWLVAGKAVTLLVGGSASTVFSTSLVMIGSLVSKTMDVSLQMATSSASPATGRTTKVTLHRRGRRYWEAGIRPAGPWGILR